MNIVFLARYKDMTDFQNFLDKNLKKIEIMSWVDEPVYKVYQKFETGLKRIGE